MARRNPSCGVSFFLTSDTVFANSSTSLFTLTDIALNLSAGVTYYFKYFVCYSMSHTNSGARFVLNGPAAPTNLAYRMTQTLTATTISTYHGTAFLSGSATTTSLLDGNIMTCDGIITPSIGGEYVMHFAAQTGGRTVSVRPGSNVFVQPMF